MNEILIVGLRVKTQIGVPEEERLAEQEVEFDIRIQTTKTFEMMQDRLEDTIDYAMVCERVSELATSRPRKLIETLASEVAEMIISKCQARRVEVELRKFILPQTRHVAVHCVREKI